MLDIISFITERGGDPEVIRESQKRRHKPVEDVDVIIKLYQESRQGMPSRRVKVEESGEGATN
ncbi:hypothetical protein ABW19_dt0208541 [Dactylella cylindrospora]|nr:hypothetical protein ABW19_dt0208541 [Dactylella cylindrospora]